jgi:hypothetical protein
MGPGNHFAMQLQPGALTVSKHTVRVHCKSSVAIIDQLRRRRARSARNMLHSSNAWFLLSATKHRVYAPVHTPSELATRYRNIQKRFETVETFPEGRAAAILSFCLLDRDKDLPQKAAVFPNFDDQSRYWHTWFIEQSMGFFPHENGLVRSCVVGSSN